MTQTLSISNKINTNPKHTTNCINYSCTNTQQYPPIHVAIYLPIKQTIALQSQKQNVHISYKFEQKKKFLLLPKTFSQYQQYTVVCTACIQNGATLHWMSVHVLVHACICVCVCVARGCTRPCTGGGGGGARDEKCM